MASSADPLTASVQTQCAIACNNIRTHVTKSHTLAATPVSGHTEILHTLVGMGSAALAEQKMSYMKMYIIFIK